MGIDFRGRHYVRRVRIGKRTVKEGEAVAIWDRFGRHRQVVGPALCRLFYSTIRFLERHVAESHQYLSVRYRDGTLEHVRGPAVLFENPVHHVSVTVLAAVRLPTDSSYLVVTRIPVGKEDREAPPAREVKVGPLLFFPEPSDLMHVFKWTDEGGGALHDEQRVVNVRATVTRDLKLQVQGADSHNACVNVLLRARLLGIKEVLAIGDPIGECDSAAKAAVLEALQSVRFGQVSGSLLEKVRANLNNQQFTASLASELKQRAACELVSLVVSSVEPSSALEKIMKQEDEVSSAKVRDQIADSSLTAAIARQEREQALEVTKQKHELKLNSERHEAELALHEASAQRHLQHLKELRALGVDLTEYLIRGPRSQLVAAGGGAGSSDRVAKPMNFLCL